MQLTSALLSPNTAADLQMTNNHLIELIKELASANNKLKSDLLDCTDLLMECKSDLYAKQQDDQHLTVPNQDEQRPILKRTESKRSIQPPKKEEDVMPQPSTSTPTSTSPTVVHHHYHYYMRNKEKGKPNAKKPSLNNLANNEVSIRDYHLKRDTHNFIENQYRIISIQSRQQFTVSSTVQPSHEPHTTTAAN